MSSVLRLDTLTAPNGSGTINIPAGNTLYAPGHVLQVVQTAITTPTSLSVPANVAAYTNIPDLTATITPKSVNSKVYVYVRWFGEFGVATSVWESMMGVKRNGTPIGYNTGGTGSSMGTAMPVLSYYSSDANSTPEQCFFDYLDSPASISPVTYVVYVNSTTAQTLYTNRTVGTGATSFEWGVSTITLWEIAG